MYFGTGWDEPDWGDLQDWAFYEAIKNIHQKPIDAPEDIPCGGVGYDARLDSQFYPLTVRRDGKSYMEQNV